MFAKKERLTSKEIRWMLRRGKRWYGKTLIFLVAPQQSNRPFHQRSIQIPVKVDKRATMRNMLKRSLLDYIQTHSGKLPQERYYKIFVMVNKKKIPDLTQLIATSEKSSILEQWIEWSAKDFTAFSRNLGNLFSRGGRR